MNLEALEQDIHHIIKLSIIQDYVGIIATAQSILNDINEDIE